MQYFAMTVEEKNELCKKGHQCKGMHSVRDSGKKVIGSKWEFDLPNEPKNDTQIGEPLREDGIKIEPEEIKEPLKLEVKKRGNPNWKKRLK